MAVTDLHCGVIANTPDLQTRGYGAMARATNLQTSSRQRSDKSDTLTRARALSADAERQRKMGAIVEWMSKGISVSTAAKEAGIARSTLYEWRDHCPEFATAWDEALVMGGDHMEDVIVDHAAKDWRAAEAWLRANRREKWGNHVKAEARVEHGTDELMEILHSIDGHSREDLASGAIADKERSEHESQQVSGNRSSRDCV